MNNLRATSLRSPSVLRKIHLAMEKAAIRSRIWGVKGQAYVRNRRGRPFLRVDHDRGQPSAFRFWFLSRFDVTPLVLTQLRRCAEVPDIDL